MAASFVFDTYVILGTGGSSLGGQTLCQESSKNLIFVENIDPQAFEKTLKSLVPERTGFVVISKSGFTIETLGQLCIVYEWLKRCGVARPEEKMLAITTDHASPLQEISCSLGVKRIPHPPQVGGRFSAFTAVGMIPVLLGGLDPQGFFVGAQEVLKNPKNAIEGAAFAFEHLQNRSIHTLMAYGDSLQLFTLWLRQLWAESLGKEGKGSALLPALGTVDQHSQLQLFAQGPDDKIYTFVLIECATQGPQLTPSFPLPKELSFFDRKTLGDMFMAEAQATYDSLEKVGRPLRKMHMPLLDAYHLGALMAHFILEVVLVAELMEINAFSQPGVEESKMLTKKYLGDVNKI